MARFSWVLVTLSVLLLAAQPESVRAQTGSAAKEIVIKDKDGVVRAVSKVEETGHVLFVVENQRQELADEVRVTLDMLFTSEKEPGDETRAEESEEGKVLFCDVKAGVWQVTTDVNWSTLREIKIDPRDEYREFDFECDNLAAAWVTSSASSVAALGGVALAGGGATVAAVQYNRHKENSQPRIPLSPSR